MLKGEPIFHNLDTYRLNAPFRTYQSVEPQSHEARDCACNDAQHDIHREVVGHIDARIANQHYRHYHQPTKPAARDDGNTRDGQRNHSRRVGRDRSIHSALLDDVHKPLQLGRVHRAQTHGERGPHIAQQACMLEDAGNHIREAYSRTYHSQKEQRLSPTRLAPHEVEYEQIEPRPRSGGRDCFHHKIHHSPTIEVEPQKKVVIKCVHTTSNSKLFRLRAEISLLLSLHRAFSRGLESLTYFLFVIARSVATWQSPALN